MSNTKALNKAFKLFNEKKYDPALKAFTDLENNESVPSWMKLRIQQFKKIADRKKNPAVAPKDGNTLMWISYHMNAGNLSEASALLDKGELSEGDTNYLRAEIAMQGEQQEEAASYLQKAIEISPDNRGYALNSPLFSSVINEELFEFLRSK